MRAMKEYKREMDMIVPFSPVAWSLLSFCVRKMWRYFHFQSPSFRPHVHLPTASPDMNIRVRRVWMQMKELTDKSLCGCFYHGQQSAIYKMCEGWNENSCNHCCRMLCWCWSGSSWTEGGQGPTAVLVGICGTVFLTDKLPKCRSSELSQTIKAISLIASILWGGSSPDSSWISAVSSWIIQTEQTDISSWVGFVSN